MEFLDWFEEQELDYSENCPWKHLGVGQHQKSAAQWIHQISGVGSYFLERVHHILTSMI